MAYKFLRSLTLANGLVKAGIFGDVADADLALADVTTNDVSATRHGFAPRLPNDAAKYLDGTGAYSVPAGSGGTGFTAPVNTDFSWVNQGGATSVQTGNTVVLTVPGSATKDNRLRVRAAPATPYRIDAHFRAIADPSNYWNAGLCWYDSGSGKHHAFSVDQVVSPILSSTKFTDVNTYAADYKTTALTLLPWAPAMYLRIADDGVNRVCSYSVDGVSYLAYHSVGRTDFLTPDRVGFWANSENSVAVAMTLFSWLQT